VQCKHVACFGIGFVVVAQFLHAPPSSGCPLVQGCFASACWTAILCLWHSLALVEPWLLSASFDVNRQSYCNLDLSLHPNLCSPDRVPAAAMGCDWQSKSVPCNPMHNQCQTMGQLQTHASGVEAARTQGPSTAHPLVIQCNRAQSNASPVAGVSHHRSNPQTSTIHIHSLLHFGF